MAFWFLVFGTTLLAGPVSWMTILPLAIMGLSIVLEKTWHYKLLNLALSTAAMMLQPALAVPMALITSIIKGLEYMLGIKVLRAAKLGLENTLGITALMSAPVASAAIAPALTASAVILVTISAISLALLGVTTAANVLKNFISHRSTSELTKDIAYAKQTVINAPLKSAPYSVSDALPSGTSSLGKGLYFNSVIRGIFTNSRNADNSSKVRLPYSLPNDLLVQFQNRKH